MIQLICRRHRLSLKHCNPHENYTITFELGVSNQKTSLIDFLLPTFTSQVSSSIPLLFHWLLFFSSLFHSCYFLSDPTTTLKFFPFLSLSVLELSILYLFNLFILSSIYLFILFITWAFCELINVEYGKVKMYLSLIVTATSLHHYW